MKRFAAAAAVLSLFAAGCDEKLNPVAPTAGQVTLASRAVGSRRGTASRFPRGFPRGRSKRERPARCRSAWSLPPLACTLRVSRSRW